MRGRASILLLVLFLLSGITPTMYAQEMIGAVENKVIPPSPSSSVFQRYIGNQPSLLTGALTTTYSHDIHGWLTKTENSRFSQELLYATGATPCYNGNISSMMWRGADGITRRYDYSYDGMSRLTDAAYSESGRIAIPGLTIQGTPDYSTSYSYDLNGNPTQIYRKGIAHKYASGSNRQWQYDEIDNLYIDYRGNQVNFTDDSCPWGYYENAPGYIEESNDDNEYTWDANGNMTKDLNRGITSIQYNLHNQPTRIVYNDRHYEGRTYNSAGQKLCTVHTVFVTSSTSSSTSTSALIIENKRDYYGEDLVYRNDTLEMVLTDNGYVDASGNYHYYILDYQGNIRQVVDAQGNVLEQNDYYPYGGLFGESASRQNYKYSGKELETMNGLNTYDFHARPYYYPVLQFHSPDLLSEKYYHVSPYLYCLGNPIKYTDPTGLRPIWNGKYGNESKYVDSETNTEVAWEDVQNYINTGSYSAENFLKYSNSEPNSSISPIGLGFEWLTGNGERNRIFTEKDKFTQLLKKHEYLEEIKAKIRISLRTYRTNHSVKLLQGNYRYNLSGISGFGKYVMDAVTLLTVGKIGNLAITYLGSHDVEWSVISISNNSATVIFHASNETTLESATRIPYIGYKDFWTKNIGAKLKIESGPCSKTTQSIIWTEEIKF